MFMAGMRMGLQMKMSQQLIMTPQLQQAIKLLQLSRHELEELIDQSLIENPTLEISPIEKDEDGDQTLESQEVKDADAGNLMEEQEKLSYDDEWQNYMESGGGVIQEAKFVSKDFNEESNPLESTISRTRSLHDHLMWQLDMANLNETEYELAEILIGNLDEDGYLAVSLNEILASSERTWELVQYGAERRLLKLVQLNPDGDLWDEKHETNKVSLDERKKKTLPPPLEEEAFDEEDSNWTPTAQITNESCRYLEGVLYKIQTLDPPGVGTRNLKECLEIQVIHMGLGNTLTHRVIQNHMKLLEQKDLQRIARQQKTTLEDTINAYQIITELEPKPGRSFSREVTQYVIPDVYIFKRISEYVVSLNQDSLPKLRINPYYMQLAEEKPNEVKEQTKVIKPAPEAEEETDLTNQYLVEKIKSGEWLMKSIEQRQRTIFKVAKSILKHQKEFFEKGIDFLKPLVLKDVAEDIDVHESTVSRITTNKYVHTPQGIFELKYFFTSGIVQGDGDVISSKKIKDHIRKLVETENLKKPLTDIQITEELLKNAGIKVARRTVAKYREALNILPSNKRKRLF